jgi:hypothetical protein
MAATLATVGALLKEVYEPRVREQLNSDILTLKRITKTSAGVSTNTGGRYVTFPIHTRRNAGVGSRLEMEALPVPGQQGHAAARIGLKSGYGGVQLTEQSIAMSDTDPKAFAKVLDDEVNGLKDDVQKDMNRQIYGDGTGAIGVIKTTNGTASATWAVTDARLFQVGAQVDLVTLPSTVAKANVTVNSIDLTPGANTITVSSTSAVTAGQIVVRQGSGPSASGNREITGLNAIISDSGVLYNIDPSVEPVWKSTIFSNSGTPRALSEGLMTQVADAVRTLGGKTTVIFQSLGVRRSYANLLTQTRQTVNTTSFTGGFSGLAFTTDNGEIPVIADVDAPLGRQYFVNEDALTYYRDQPWNWRDRDGSMWKQVRDASGDYDAWYARLGEFHELGTDRRNTHAILQDIIES